MPISSARPLWIPDAIPETHRLNRLRRAGSLLPVFDNETETDISRVWMCAIAGLIGLPQLRVTVNIPAYRLDVYVGDSLARTMEVAVGMPRFPTPRGAFAITSVEWNPWWIPPDRPWAARERPMRPGPGNPMGHVKLNFRPLYFLHGTPLERSIGTAASHGCIRLANADAIDLARLVHRFGSLTLTPDDIEALATDTVVTRTLQLDPTVPLEIRYDLVEIQAGRLTVYPDIYRLARRSLREEVYAALAARGVDTASIDSTRVRAFVRRIAPRGNEIAIDSLMRGGGASIYHSSLPDSGGSVTTRTGHVAP